MYKGANFVHIN